MERLKSSMKSIFGTLILAALAGCLIQIATGDWDGSLLYLDAALSSMAIYLFVSLFLVRMEHQLTDNKLFFFVAIVIWTGTILFPFILIGMKQGRAVLFGILFGLIISIVFWARANGKKEYQSKNTAVWFFLITLLFPFVYALVIWFDLQLTALFLLLAAVNILIYVELLIKDVLSFYKSKEGWKPLQVELPEEKPIVLSEGMTPVQHVNHLELGFIETSSCQLKFPITYEVNGLYYNQEAFVYTWFAPFENKIKAFDWETDLKGQSIYLIYDPEEPSLISVGIGTTEGVEQMIFNYKKKQKKYQFAALGMAIVGIFLFFLR
jgi:hypothetical protein